MPLVGHGMWDSAVVKLQHSNEGNEARVTLDCSGEAIRVDRSPYYDWAIQVWSGSRIKPTTHTSDGRNTRQVWSQLRKNGIDDLLGAAQEAGQRGRSHLHEAWRWDGRDGMVEMGRCKWSLVMGIMKVILSEFEAERKKGKKGKTSVKVRVDDDCPAPLEVNSKVDLSLRGYLFR